MGGKQLFPAYFLLLVFSLTNVLRDRRVKTPRKYDTVFLGNSNNKMDIMTGI